MKKKIKTIKKETSSSRKEDQFAVILEGVNSRLDLVLESFGTLDKKIDRVHSELKEEIVEFKAETRNNFKIFREDVDEKFKKVDENFERVFDFQDRAEANFKVTLEYLSRLDDEIQTLREEMKQRPALAAIFEKRMNAMEKDLAICKKALALG